MFEVLNINHHVWLAWMILHPSTQGTKALRYQGAGRRQSHKQRPVAWLKDMLEPRAALHPGRGQQKNSFCGEFGMS